MLEYFYARLDQFILKLKTELKIHAGSKGQHHVKFMSENDRAYWTHLSPWWSSHTFVLGLLLELLCLQKCDLNELQ